MTMANIGANTNLPTGTGRSYQTPEKQFGKDIGQAKYQAKPDFADTLDVTEDSGMESMASSSPSVKSSEGSSFDFDSVVSRAQEILKSAGTYVKENRRVVMGAAVALSAVGIGVYLVKQKNARNAQ